MRKERDIVISSRVRLARNVAGLPFPALLGDGQAKQLPREVYASVSGQDRFRLYSIERLGLVAGNVLKEKHLVSEDLLQNKATGAAIINETETVSIMVNEEDHIRIQCILDGYDLKEAYKTANQADDQISKKVRYAFDTRLGYLTACPTNLGTGMRASAMMFLPGLSICNSLEVCINAIARLNMEIRGVYGEGSESAGYMYQVSNQRTLGLSELEIIDAVEMSVGHIEDAELRAREALVKNGGAEFRDKIQRAYGILTNAYILGSAEFMQLISLVKLGSYYGFIKLSDKDRFEKLIVEAQPASLQTRSNQELSPEERDIFRASYVAKTVKSLLL